MVYLFLSSSQAYSLLCCVCSVVSNHCDPTDCSPPGSSVHGIFQKRIILQWSGLSFSPLGDIPNPEIEPTSPVSPALKVDSLPAEPYNLKARSKIKMPPGLLPSECSEGQSVCSMPVLASGDSRKPWCFWLTDHPSIPCLCPHTGIFLCFCVSSHLLILI